MNRSYMRITDHTSQRHKWFAPKKWYFKTRTPPNLARVGRKPKKQIICYLCYEIGTHISPRCTAKLNDMDLVVANYEKLTDEQKQLVPDDSYKLAKRYIDMRLELSNMNRKNEQPAEDSSKN